MAIGISEFSYLLFFLTVFIFSYAEIHFRIPGIFSRLFKKEPEIVFDLPFRGVIGNRIPFFLFIKDAHHFPAKLLDLQVMIAPQNLQTSLSHTIKLNETVQGKFFSKTIYLSPDFFPESGAYRVSAELNYQINDKRLTLWQDNYSGISHEPFTIYIAKSPLPDLPNLYWGDLHTHSNYTDDQIEFGAPIRESVICAQTVGLQFLAITDHSYDLDDKTGSYLENDPSLPKWQQFKEEIKSLNHEFPAFHILGGEEVSAGNSKAQNVHCLVLGNRTFYPGSGDSGEKPLNNKPTMSLKSLYEKIEHSREDAIIAAAHPFDEPPYAHQIALNRGYWHKADLSHPALDYWQILNGRIDRFFENGRRSWIKALLNRQKVGILGGTDAHGNFNCFRQITIPFWKMIRCREQLFGEMRTGIFSETALNPQTLLQTLKEKRTIISTGPAASLEIFQNDRLFHIGNSIKTGTAVSIEISAVSNSEFGSLKSVVLYTGVFSQSKEISLNISLPENCFRFKKKIDLTDGTSPGYLRLEVYSEKTGKSYLCFTNPIWIEE